MTIAEAHEFNNLEKEIFYRVIFSRRDVRKNFISKPIPDEILFRILNAAHHAPSVGYSQPWNFILVRSKNLRLKIKESFIKERNRSIDLLNNDLERKQKYKNLKLEGILESYINICVTYDNSRFGPFVIGRMTIDQAGIYSVCCAIQNLWLAARVEGVGLGWVSILDNNDLSEILNLPNTIKPIAYLCLGYVNKFNDMPDLEESKWLKRIDLKNVISFETWNNFDDKKWNNFKNILEKNSIF